jgi:hypothetical protein
MAETELLTPQEYARYRRCSVRTLDRERAVGIGCPYVKLGARILYRRSDIQTFLEAHLRGTDRIRARGTSREDARHHWQSRKSGAVEVGP